MREGRMEAAFLAECDTDVWPKISAPNKLYQNGMPPSKKLFVCFEVGRIKLDSRLFLIKKTTPTFTPTSTYLPGQATRTKSINLLIIFVLYGEKISSPKPWLQSIRRARAMHGQTASPIPAAFGHSPPVLLPVSGLLRQL
jgi:hypothetical protein